MQNRRYEFCGSRGGMSEWRAQAQKTWTRRWTLRIKMFMRIRGNVYCGLFVISLDDRIVKPRSSGVFSSLVRSVTQLLPCLENGAVS